MKEKIIKYIIELDNGKFAKVDYEGGTHIGIYGYTDFTKATMFNSTIDLNEIYEELIKFNKVGFGFDSNHSEYQFHGDCIIPRGNREVEFTLN